MNRHDKRSRRSLLGVVAALACLAAAGCGVGSNSSSVSSGGGTGGSSGTLVVALNQSVSSLPVVAANKEGFFRKHGLTVKTTVQPNVTLIPQLLGRQYDIGFTVVPIAVSAASHGLDVTLISGNNFNSPALQAGKLIAAKGIKSVGDLKGKTIAAITTTGSLNLATLAWLNKNGVRPSDTKVVQVAPADMVPQLKKGIVGAIESNYPFSTQALNEGFTNLGDPENELYGKTVDSYWLASGAWASQHQKVVGEFKAALDDANAWMTGHADAARQLMAADFGIPVQAAAHIPLDQFQTAYTQKDVQAWVSLMQSFGGFKGTVNYQKLIH